MNREKDLIGDVLVAAGYADRKGWCCRPFHKFTGAAVNVNGKWEPTEPFDDTLFGRRQLEALVAHFHMCIECDLDVHGWTLTGYDESVYHGHHHQNHRVIVAHAERGPNAEHYRELYIKYIRERLKTI